MYKIKSIITQAVVNILLNNKLKNKNIPYPITPDPENILPRKLIRWPKF